MWQRQEAMAWWQRTAKRDRKLDVMGEEKEGSRTHLDSPNLAKGAPGEEEQELGSNGGGGSGIGERRN
jgi:hypothetical protein